MRQYSLIIVLGAIVIFLAACEKYLEKKPDLALKVPTSLTDFQSLLDQNKITASSSPALGDLGCDNYYLKYETYQSQTTKARNCYIWASDIWEGQSASDWNNGYTNIYICNVVLDGLKSFRIVGPDDQIIVNKIIGHALFVRALCHFFLEETFGQPYKPASANSDLGIPLKTTSNLADIAIRHSTKEVYEQIIEDLLLAIRLLPTVNFPRNRPSKAAAFAMLARVYLTAQDYEKAAAYADSSLQLNGLLYDYNLFSPHTASYTFPAPPNDFVELLYPVTQVGYSALTGSTTIIDTTLYNSYDSNDLRKYDYFRLNTTSNTFYFKGQYTGSSPLCNGPATDEMYLIRSEANARLGLTDSAMADLNRLMKMRWRTGYFAPFSATDADDALRIILAERRKELLFRGLRWIDLRRLNQDPRFQITLTRILNGQTYTLPPNDKRYTYPIPDNEIQLSGIPQNPR